MIYRIFTIICSRNIVLTALLISAAPLHAGETVVGNTWPIAEGDALDELESRASGVEWEKVFDKKKMQKKIKKFRPKDMTSLPHVLDDRTRLVDITYTLEVDLPDENGNVIYPKGYTFNPARYAVLRRILVVIDGSSKKHVEWFVNSEWFDSPETMLLISDGSWFDLSNELSRPVFYLPKQLVERFDIEAVPSVIRQKGEMMEVIEVYVDQKDNN